MRTQENCRKGLHCIARVLEKITQQCTHSRPKGHEPTFVKFTFANDEQLALEIDITDQQPNRLTDAQSQSVEDCEDSAVGHGSQWNTRIVRQGTATSSKRRAAIASKMNGSRSAVRRLGLASIGTQQRNPCKTANGTVHGSCSAGDCNFENSPAAAKAGTHPEVPG